MYIDANIIPDIKSNIQGECNIWGFTTYGGNSTYGGNLTMRIQHTRQNAPQNDHKTQRKKPMNHARESLLLDIRMGN